VRRRLLVFAVAALVVGSGSTDADARRRPPEQTPSPEVTVTPSPTPSQTPSPTPSPEPSPREDFPEPDRPGFFDVIGKVRYAIGQWFSNLVTSALRPVFDFLGRTVFSTPPLADNDRIVLLWGFSLAIADSLLLLLLLIGAGLVTVGGGLGSQLTAKELLPRLVVAAIAANVSLILLRQMIELSNALASGILGASLEPSEVSRLMIRLLANAALLNPFLALLGLAAIVVLSTRSFETRYPERQVRRDHTATVIVTGTGMARDLLVNGTSTTVLTPVTKWMAHVPLAFLERRPADALVICFGMGTTFRSLLSWDIRVTAVELVPSVPEFFPYFHADARELMRLPNARVVIDDGRRFLERSPDTFDVITIDPPNPPEAAGSSLLYSREFYTLARTRLRPGGILQQWIPVTDLGTIASVTRALDASFPHVRAFPSVNLGPTLQVGGVHYLASDRPIPRYSVAELVERLPARAAWDLIEWPIEPTVEGNFARLLGHEMPLAALTRLAPRAPILADDRPFNEYFLLRRWVLARSQPGS